MNQIGRNVTNAVDGLLNGKRYLIHDRDPLFMTEFQNILASVGVTSVKLPPQSPNLNAYAERFVRSIKESCLDRLILFGEASLRKAIRDFILHYHEERNHRGKGNQLLFPRAKLPTRRRTGRFAVSSGSAGCPSTIIGKRHEDRPGADPVGWLLRGWIALRRRPRF
jgi:transposase InsO family protein